MLHYSFVFILFCFYSNSCVDSSVSTTASFESLFTVLISVQPTPLQSWILYQDLKCTIDPVAIVTVLLQLQFVYSYVLF